MPVCKRSPVKVGKRGQLRCLLPSGSGLPSWPSLPVNANEHNEKQEKNRCDNKPDRSSALVATVRALLGTPKHRRHHRAQASQPSAGGNHHTRKETHRATSKRRPHGNCKRRNRARRAGWLDQIGKGELSRNTLKHIKSVVSGMFTLAKQQNYFDGINPAQNTAINPARQGPKKPMPTAWRKFKRFSRCSLSQRQQHSPSPASWGCAPARSKDYSGRTTGIDRYSFPAVSGMAASTIRRRARDVRLCRSFKPLAKRLEMHRLRCGNPTSGPMFTNSAGEPQALNSMVDRVILPALNRCATCGKPERHHRAKANHVYQRNSRLPEWHGWHSARRGLGSNLYRFGCPRK